MCVYLAWYRAQRSKQFSVLVKFQLWLNCEEILIIRQKFEIAGKLHLTMIITLKLIKIIN